jgi:hypothetical protein
MSTQNIFDLTDTWDNAGTTFVGIKLNATDTASAAGSLLMDLQVGGVSQFKVAKSGQLTAGVNFLGGAYIGVASGNTSINYGNNQAISTGAGGVRWNSASIDSPDVFLLRDAANTLAQRNGTNAQTFRVYETYTDGSNFTRGSIAATSSGLDIATQSAGTGSKRPVRILGQSLASAEAVSALEIAQTWNTTGTPTAIKANITDTASDSASLLMDLQVGGSSKFNVSKGGALTLGSAVWPSYLRLDDGTGANGVHLYRAGTGILTLYNTAENDFGRLQFGGTTSSFPALKRNSTALETKLADDSAYAPHAMQYLDINDGITAPAAATGRARIYVDTADGDLKVIFADGTIKTIATDT